MKDKKCIICDSSFVGYGRKKTCSNECRLAHNRNRNEGRSARDYAKKKQAKDNTFVRCKNCGTQYLWKDGGNKYCSESCAKKAASSIRNSKRRASIKKTNYVENVNFHDIYERDGGECCYCGVETPLEFRGTFSDFAPEIDHIIPLSRGGIHASFNLHLSCRKCNIKKSNKIYPSDIKKAKDMYPESLNVHIRSSKESVRKIKTGDSGYRGVVFDKSKNKYRSRIWQDGKYKHLGFFDNPKEASFAHESYRTKILKRA